MTLRNGIALTCIAIPAIAEIIIGVRYFWASQITAYHKEVLGVPWSDLEPGVQRMLVAFMNAYGSGHFAVGVALGLLVVIPLRRGEGWARWAILAVGLPVLGVAVLGSVRLALTTGAQTPWQPAVVLLVLFLVGIALVNPKQAAQRLAERDGP